MTSICPQNPTRTIKRSEELAAALDGGRADPRVAIALLDAGRACGRDADAAALAARYVANAWNAGRRGEAAQVWQRVVTDQPGAPLDTRLRLALAPALAAAGQRRAAALTLRGELRERERALSPGTALRIAELARAVHPDTAIEAAQRALRSDALDAGKRARIEAMIRELEGDPARLEELDLEPLPSLEAPTPAPGEPAGAIDLADPRERGAGAEPGDPDDPRAIRLDPGEELTEPEPVQGPAFADVADLAPATAPAAGPRFTSCQVIEAVPRRLEGAALRFALSDGSESTLPLARVQAVALAAVRGLAAKPVLLLDMILNWSDAGDAPLKIARARSDRFDPRAVVPAGSPLDALRELAAAVCARSGALALLDAAQAGGDPVRVFDALADYEREVLRIGAGSAA